LVITRNATRDYIDLAALSDRLGAERTWLALKDMDKLYPQDSGESPLRQLLIQLSSPLPYDLDETDLSK
jgi:hypothetical protein